MARDLMRKNEFANMRAFARLYLRVNKKSRGVMVGFSYIKLQRGRHEGRFHD